MTLTYSTAMRNRQANSFGTGIDSGASDGVIKIYDSGDVLLVTLTFSSTSFHNAAGGVATANTITSGTAVAGGTASYFLFEDSDGVYSEQGSITVTGGDGDMKLESLTITLGQIVSITMGTLTQSATT